jgi:hypothetical protein
MAHVRSRMESETSIFHGNRRAAGVAVNTVGGRAQDLRVGQQERHLPRSKKDETKPWLEKRFCIPPKNGGAFVHAMEDVLEVYHRPYDVERPQICLDETSKQLLEHTRIPLPAAPGQPSRVDDEYKCCGTANIFAAVEPLTGWCALRATEHRTHIDTALFLRQLSEKDHRRPCGQRQLARVIGDDVDPSS